MTVMVLNAGLTLWAVLDTLFLLGENPVLQNLGVHDKCIQITIRSNGHFSEDDIRDLARKISNDLRDVEQLGGS